jgi:hypothetical protein
MSENRELTKMPILNAEEGIRKIKIGLLHNKELRGFLHVA